MPSLGPLRSVHQSSISSCHTTNDCYPSRQNGHAAMFWGMMAMFLNGISKRIWILALAGVAAGASMADVKPAVAQAAGDLIVAPTRVVFEGRDRSAQLSLVNKGSATATYRVSVVNMRMQPDGSLVEIAQPDPGQEFADDLFRYSPRQVTLEPGASQAIRLLLRKPADLKAGEYRSHLMMRAVPDNQGQSVEGPQEGAAVRIIPIFGIAIPVIIRHGELTYGTEVKDLGYVAPDADNPLPRARFTLERSGNRSSFGDLTASVNIDGKDVVLSQIMRLAVYTPNTTRGVEMLLRVPDGVNISGKELTVRYAETADDGGKVLGEAKTQIP